MSVPVAFLSLIAELAFGYPERLVQSIGHPVIWIGALISRLDKALNRETASDAVRRLMGVVALAAIVLIPAGIALGLEYLFGTGWLGLAATALVGSSLLAQRSLASHVKAVADALETGGLAAGRKAVSQIVGRDPETLDEAGVSREAGRLMRSSKRAAAQPKASWRGVRWPIIESAVLAAL